MVGGGGGGGGGGGAPNSGWLTELDYQVNSTYR